MNSQSIKFTDIGSRQIRQMAEEENNPDVILGNFKQMGIECSNLASKIQELNIEKDEHRLVVDTLSHLEGGRKAFRLVGGVLVERTVAEFLPIVSDNFEGVE
jgi:prefoldin subunit 2